MAKSPLSTLTKRAEQQDVSRRALIKWTVAAGAALGVSRSRVFEILEKTAGTGVAFAASAAPTARSVHCVMGNGGLAWTRQLWPNSRRWTAISPIGGQEERIKRPVHQSLP